MKDHSDQLCMHVSPGAADLLTSLSEHLHILEEFISILLFGPLMEKITQGLDQLILTEVSGLMFCNTMFMYCLPDHPEQ